MTKVTLKHPTPAERRYTGNDIHDRVCQHQKEWRTLPELARMSHSRDASRVTGVAWFYYCGVHSMEEITREFQVSEATVHTLGKILGITPPVPRKP